jgi:hypothetical protein
VPLIAGPDLSTRWAMYFGKAKMDFMRAHQIIHQNYDVPLSFSLRYSTIELQNNNKKTPWSDSASELYRPSDRRLSAKWYSTFADRGWHVVSVTDPYGRILGFIDRSRYFSIKDHFSCTHEAEWTPFQTHYFFFGSAGNRTRTSGSAAKNSNR